MANVINFVDNFVFNTSRYRAFRKLRLKNDIPEKATSLESRSTWTGFFLEFILAKMINFLFGKECLRNFESNIQQYCNWWVVYGYDHTYWATCILIARQRIMWKMCVLLTSGHICRCIWVVQQNWHASIYNILHANDS